MTGQPRHDAVVAASELTSFAQALLRAAGFGDAAAAQSAEMLVWANARGVESHGVLRLPRYVEWARLGIVDPAAAPAVAERSGAVALIEGGRAPGALAMNLAADTAVGLAAQYRIGWCSARQISHAGAIGFFAERIARQGCIGVVMTASKPLMAYHGSRGEGVSTNPLAISVPTEDEPVTFDMSTASVALGKVMAAKDAGRPIPAGWAVDEAGATTTDPSRVKALLPMAGPKGSGLSLMIEALCSLLAANPIIARALGGGGEAGFNGAALALDAGMFGSPDTFRHQAAELFAAVKGLPIAPGVEEVLLPGERSRRTARLRMRDGIPIARGTGAGLLALAAEFGVPPPPGLRAAGQG